MLGSGRLVAFVGTVDLGRAQDFYRGALGLTLTAETPIACVFDANGTTLRVTLVEEVAHTPYTSLGWVVPDIEAVVRSLQASDVTLQHFDGMGQDDLGVWTAPSGDRVAWFKDPDGNALSITEVRASSTTDPVTWEEIVSRLSAPRIYWLHTTNASGTPQATPLWGVVVDSRLYFYSARSTVKARNIARDSRVLVHLESGADVVIVHGLLADVGHPGDAPAVVEAFACKYDSPDEQPFLPSRQSPSLVLYALQPERAVLWTLPDSEASTRRWAVNGP